MRLADMLLTPVIPLSERKPSVKPQSVAGKPKKHKRCVSETATYVRYKKAFRGEKVTARTLAERLKIDRNSVLIWLYRQEKKGGVQREGHYRILWWLV